MRELAAIEALKSEKGEKEVRDDESGLAADANVLHSESFSN